MEKNMVKYNIWHEILADCTADCIPEVIVFCAISAQYAWNTEEWNYECLYHLKHKKKQGPKSRLGMCCVSDDRLLISFCLNQMIWKISIFIFIQKGR